MKEKKITVFIAILVIFSTLFFEIYVDCAPDERWEYVAGGKLENYQGNKVDSPGSRKYSFVCGKDLSTKKIYMFGGYGYSGSAGLGTLSQLWSYDSTSRWSFLYDPPVDVDGLIVHGNYGEFNASFTPQARSNGKCFLRGEILYIFSGRVYASQDSNDLWGYNFTNNQWAIFTGNTTYGLDTGNYSSGIGKPCRPHSRIGYTLWDDYRSGNEKSKVFMFGGRSKVGNTLNTLNDMLEFDFNLMTWKILLPIYSYNSIPNVNQTYFGQYHSTHHPGGVVSSSGWIDQRYGNGELYLHGGYIWDGSQNIRTNQLFSYSLDSLKYKPIIKHDSNQNMYGSEFREEFTSINDFPRKQDANVFYNPGENFVYLFGGETGTFGTTPEESYVFNDLWILDFVNAEYRFITGYTFATTISKQHSRWPPKYDKPHYPGSIKGNLGWVVKENEQVLSFYIFGGSSYDGKLFGDLWNFGIYQCYGEFSFYPEECSDHGSCEQDHTCTCDKDYGDDNCSKSMTALVRLLMLLESFGYTRASLDALTLFGYFFTPVIPLMLCYCCFCICRCNWKSWKCCFGIRKKLKGL